LNSQRPLTSGFCHGCPEIRLVLTKEFLKNSVKFDSPRYVYAMNANWDAKVVDCGKIGEEKLDFSFRKSRDANWSQANRKGF
jgi:hypothetical protein